MQPCLKAGMHVYLFTAEYFRNSFLYTLLIYVYFWIACCNSWYMAFSILSEFMDSALLHGLLYFALIHRFFSFFLVLYSIILSLLLLIPITCSILIFVDSDPWVTLTCPGTRNFGEELQAKDLSLQESEGPDRSLTTYWNNHPMFYINCI